MTSLTVVNLTSLGPDSVSSNYGRVKVGQVGTGGNSVNFAGNPCWNRRGTGLETESAGLLEFACRCHAGGLLRATIRSLVGAGHGLAVNYWLPHRRWYRVAGWSSAHDWHG